MRLATVYVRFYKSFNFDYMRKYHRDSRPMPWEDEGGGPWFPYVRVPIEPLVTTIVGANESGKSQLLSAIENGIPGTDIRREDFCRYSQFFTVQRGKMRCPDFGFHFSDLNKGEQEAVRKACKLTGEAGEFDEFLLFRVNATATTVYLPDTGGSFTPHHVAGKDATALGAVLPRIFRIDAKVGIPDSVPIPWLLRDGKKDAINTTFGRVERFDLIAAMGGLSGWFASGQAVQQNATAIAEKIGPLLSAPPVVQDSSDYRQRLNELDLARKLLFDVAEVGPEAFTDLWSAVRDGRDGYANGLMDRINDRLAAKLNFPMWWVQDTDFALLVSCREQDLVFTIRDRTNTEYSFKERSHGLKYFLSYYVQYLSHKPSLDHSEILLMDEPDAYLSAQGQQDLLKIFDDFATPVAGRPGVQVVYVTHSPFLIDKNHAERIRVLEKGTHDEGTRVVRDAGKNHYEPLRSAFGASVGETTFIGSCNLMVEGLTDQILIAGSAAHLRARGATELETLDLNRITIVPAGSADHVPYLVYLAIGRDVERPAVIVLLDSDQAGNSAKDKLLSEKRGKKRLLPEEYIFQIGALSTESEVAGGNLSLREIEDLIPLPLCVAAARIYARGMCRADDAFVESITLQAIEKHLPEGRAVFDAIEACFAELSEGDFHIEKLGFARCVVDRLGTVDRGAKDVQDSEREAVERFDANMRALFRRLSAMQRKAERDRAKDRISQRIARARKSFLDGHVAEALREHALLILEEIQDALDDSSESDSIRAEIQGLIREYSLREGHGPISNFEAFRDALRGLQYAGRQQIQTPDAGGPEPSVRMSARSEER